MRRAVAFVIVVGILCFWLYAGTDFARNALQDGKSRIVVSPETTFLVEPVDEQGYLECVKALNLALSQGVTRENNAAVLWLEAVGFRAEGNVLQFQAQELGCEVPDESEPFYRDAASQPRNKLTLFVPLEQHERVTSGPWKGSEYPEALAWVEANEQALSKVAEAVKRPVYYVPREGASVWSILLPDVQQTRAVARCLIARAYLRLEQGEFDLAWEDLMTSSRLARMIGKGPFFIERLVGIAIDGQTNVAILKWLESLPVMYTDLDARIEEFVALGPFQGMDSAFEYERLMLVDFANHLERGQDVEDLMQGQQIGWQTLLGRGVDWNVVLTKAGEHYELLKRTAQIADASERRLELIKISTALRAENDKLTAQYSSASGIAGSLFRSKEQVSLDTATLLLGLLSPAAEHLCSAEDRSSTEREMTRLALLLKKYQLEHGKFPATLEELGADALRTPEGERGFVVETAYRCTDTELLLYHFGNNLTDEQGPAEQVDEGADEDQAPKSDDRGIRWKID